MKYAIFLMLIGTALVTHAGDIAAVEARKIEYLIAAVETLDGAQFIRNGTAYGTKRAADHLRLKLNRAGSRVKTAEDFIRCCASVSSVSGKPYQIRFTDGRVLTAEAYFRQKLTELQIGTGGT